MPSATFAADFSSILKEIDRVENAITKLELKPRGVESAFDRLQRSYSGANIVQQAEITSRAIEQIGGTSKLTSTELQRAGSIAKDAAAKMTALGVDVPPHIMKLAAAIDPIPTKLSLAERAAGLAKSTFGQMFGAFTAVNLVERAVGTIVDFGKEVFTAASRTVDLSDKLGISTAAVQRFDFVAKQTGSSVEDFASAAFKLQTRLGGGSDSVRDGVERLGLSFSQLKALKPEEQFDLIAAKLGGVREATERNKLGVDIFGKSFERIAAAVAAGYGDIAKHATISGDDQVRALDNVGDKWEELKGRIGAVTTSILGNISSIVLKAADMDFSFLPKGLGLIGGSKVATGDISGLVDPSLEPSTIAATKATQNYAQALAAARKEVAALTPEQRKQIDAARELGAKMDDLADEYGISENAIRLYNTQVTQSAKTTKDATKEVDQMWQAMQAFLSEANNAEGLKRMNQDLDVLASSSSKATKELQKLVMVAETGSVSSQLWNQGGGLIADLSKAIPASISSQDISKAFGATLGQGLKFGMKVAVQDLPQVVMQALTGGGDLVKSLGGLFGGSLATSISGNLTAALKGSLGSLIGGGLGSILPGVGTILGSLAGKLFGGLFGGGEGAKTNDLRDKAFDAAGGFDYLNERAAKAGFTLDSVLSAKRVKDFDSAWADLQMRLGESEADQERLTAALEKYGFTLEEMPKKFQQSELDKQAKELIEDWRVLTAAFEGTTVVNAKMAESINDYLQTALKVGAEIPAAMKPILQSMVDQGVLVDENGEKITDLEKAGVKFSETMTQGFDRVVQKLQELIDKLNHTGSAIQNIPDVHVGVQYDDPGPPHQAEPREEAFAMATGGSGRVSRPTLFLAGERGPEDFAFSGANKSFSNSDVAAAIERLRSDLRVLPIALRDAVLVTGTA